VNDTLEMQREWLGRNSVVRTWTAVEFLAGFFTKQAVSVLDFGLFDFCSHDRTTQRQGHQAYTSLSARTAWDQLAQLYRKLGSSLSKFSQAFSPSDLMVLVLSFFDCFLQTVRKNERHSEVTTHSDIAPAFRFMEFSARKARKKLD
jgi:hypothetical protein